MNERIQLLALQAGMGETKLGVGKIYQFYGDGLERFAELIVQECVAQCEQVAADADAMAESRFVTDMRRQLHEGRWSGAKNCTAQIREHFGVEE